MLFSEPTFLFFFLPAVLLAYFAVGRAARDAVLVAASLGFYAWGEGPYVTVLLVSIALNWAAALWVGRARDAVRARRITVAACVANLALLIGFKYANFLADNLSFLLVAIAMPPIVLAPVHLPIGISFFAFQGMSYVIDVSRGECAPQKSLLKMAMYKSFFPQLIAGPIVRYVDVNAQVEDRTVTVDDFAQGIRRFVIGLGKKMIIANAVARPTDAIFALPADQLDGKLAWIAIVGYTLQIYFDFSAYSDMAIGLGRMFGFRFLENFAYPYAATSMTDFWRRWHISLSGWFRDYLYIPLGGNRVAPWRRYVNLMTVFVLCGLWHGASWNFAIWGLFHGAFLILERLSVVERLRVPFRPLHHAYVMLVVVVSWVFFRADTLHGALAMLRAMAGLATPTVPSPGVGLYVDREVVLAALLGVLFAGPVVPHVAARLDAWRRRYAPADTAVDALHVASLVGVLAYSVTLMAAGSYSPFIYFRF